VTSGPVVAQAVSLVDADAIDHFAAVLRHDVEEIEDDLRLRAPGAYLLDEACSHVHRHGLNALAALGAQQLEERSDVLSAAPAADPQHALARRLYDHRRIAVPLLDGELVHADHADSGQINRPELSLQVPAIDLFDRVPSQAVELGHVQQGHDLAHPRHAHGQARGDARIGLEPVEMLELWPAVRTQHPKPR